MRSPKNVSEKNIVPLLFLLHKYRNSRKLCVIEILGMPGKHCVLVNCVSEYLFKAWFIFYDKEETFYSIIIYIILLNFIYIKKENWALNKKSETFTGSECFLYVTVLDKMLQIHWKKHTLIKRR